MSITFSNLNYLITLCTVYFSRQVSKFSENYPQKYNFSFLLPEIYLKPPNNMLCYIIKYLIKKFLLFSKKYLLMLYSTAITKTPAKKQVFFYLNHYFSILRNN